MSVTVSKHMPFLLVDAQFRNGYAAAVTLNGNVDCNLSGPPVCTVSTTSTSSEFKCTITCQPAQQPINVNSISVKVVDPNNTNVAVFDLTSNNCQISNATSLTLYLSQTINIQQQ